MISDTSEATKASLDTETKKSEKDDDDDEDEEESEEVTWNLDFEIEF